MLRAAALALLIVSGCSVLKNTRAQDLAWERWKQCDHFPGVSLTKIETNGLVWVQYGSMSEYRDWDACMYYALQDQRRDGKMTPDAEPPKWQP